MWGRTKASCIATGKRDTQRDGIDGTGKGYVSFLMKDEQLARDDVRQVS